MMQQERTDKASGLISFVTVLRERTDPAVFARVLARLDPDSRALVEHPPLAVTWISNEPFMKMLTACQDVAWGGSPDPVFDLSREMLRRDMTGIYKVLMHLASTETVIKKAAAIYGTYTHNGKMTPKILGGNRAEIVLGPVRRGHPAFWEFQRGAITGVLEVAGTRSPSVRIGAGGGTANTTTFEISWK